MPEEPLALKRPEPLPTQEDYDAIHAAVMETWRGRWFLSEYAKRNRHADTAVLLVAIERIEAALRLQPAESPPPVKMAIVEPLRALKVEAAASPPAAAPVKAEPLSTALYRIRAAAGRLQEMALTLKRTSGDVGAGALQARVAEILQACGTIEAAQSGQTGASQRAAPLAITDRVQRPAPEPLPSAAIAPTAEPAPPASEARSTAFAPTGPAVPQPAFKIESRPQLMVRKLETAPASAEPAPAPPDKPTTLRSAIARDPLAPLFNLTEFEKLAVFG